MSRFKSALIAGSSTAAKPAFSNEVVTASFRRSPAAGEQAPRIRTRWPQRFHSTMRPDEKGARLGGSEVTAGEKVR